MSEISNDENTVNELLPVFENCGLKLGENKSDIISDDCSAKDRIEFNHENKPELSYKFLCCDDGDDDLYNIQIDLAQNDNMLSIESKDEKPENVDLHNNDNHLDKSGENRFAFSSGEKNFIKPISSNDAYDNSEKDNCNSPKNDLIISHVFLAKKTIESDDEGAELGVSELVSKEDNDLLGISQISENENVHSMESTDAEVPGNVNLHDNNFDESVMLAVTSDEKPNDFIKPIRTEKRNSCEQTNHAYDNSEKDACCDSLESDLKILDDFLAKNTIESYHEKTKLAISEEDNDLLIINYDISQNDNKHCIESKEAPENVHLHVDGNNCDKSVMHAVNSDEKQKNFIKPINTVISNSRKLTIDAYDSSENEDCISHKSNFKISDDFLAKNLLMESDHENTKFGVSEFIPEEVNDLLIINCDLSQNEDMQSIESNDGAVPEYADVHDDSINNFDESVIHLVSSGEKQKNCIKPIDTEINSSGKQTAQRYCNSEKNDCKSVIVDVHLENISIKDRIRSDKIIECRNNVELETQKHQRNTSNIYGEGYCVINDEKEVNEDKITSCLDTSTDNLSVIVRENEFKNDNSTVNNREKSRTIYEKFSILCDYFRKEQMNKVEKEKPFKITNSEIKTIPNDSNTIFICDNEDENCVYEISTENANDFRKEGNSNADVQSREKFCEELDNELEILKAEYSDIERKLVDATKIFTVEDICVFVTKVKNELTGFMQSLEELRTRFCNEHAKPEVASEHVKPSRSYRQNPEKSAETLVHGCKFQSNDYTGPKEKRHSLYEKIEVHHSFEHHSQLSPQETTETTGKCRHRPKQFSSFGMKTIKNLQKRKSSPYECNFQRSPDKRYRISSKKCCLSKNHTFYSKGTLGSTSEEESKYRSYSRELDHYTKMRGFSKSYIAHKKLRFPKSSSEYYYGRTSHPKQSPKSSSLSEKYRNFLLRTSRKEVSQSRYEKKYKLQEYSSEFDLSSDSSDSLQFSSVSDREFGLTHSESKYYGRDKYVSTIPRKVISVEKDKLSSRNKSYRKGSKRSHSERERSSMFSSDSDFYDSGQENVISFGKKYDKVYKNNSEKKRVHGLMNRRKKKFKGEINRMEDMTSPPENQKKKLAHSLMNRQIDIINKHTLRKDDLAEHEQDFYNPSNTERRKYKGKSYLGKEKFKGEINRMEDWASPPGNRKKKEFRQVTTPCKLDKTRNQTDAHSSLKNNIQSTPGDILKSKNLQSVVVPISSHNAILPVETKKRKNEMETNYFSTKNLGDQLKKQNDSEFSNFDSKCSDKTCDYVDKRRNEDFGEWFENELNRVKDIDSFRTFLAKKNGKYTNADLLFKKPVVDYISPEKLSFNTAQRPKHKANIDKVQTENALPQEKNGITKTELASEKNNSDELKTKTSTPQIVSKDAESKKKKEKKMPVEGKREVSSVSNKSLDLFKKLNQEIRKKKIPKRTPVAPKTNDSDVNYETSRIEKATSPSVYDDVSLNKTESFPLKFNGRKMELGTVKEVSKHSLVEDEVTFIAELGVRKK